MKRRTFAGQALAATAAALCGPLPASAQAFPARPIRIVVPFNAGASVDTTARSVAELMRQDLGQPVLVDNKPGANAAIGAAAVVNSAPDGYTLFFASDSALVLNGLLYKKLAYDAERDFRAVGLAVNVPLVMVVNAASPATSVAEFVQLARKDPGKLTYSSTGNGGLFHLAAELFSQKAGIEMTHVPYTGGAPALQALLAGQVDVMFGIVGSALQQVRAGKLRALAVVTGERVEVLPGIPTLQESGYAGLEALARYALVAPAKTPPAVLARLNHALNFALSNPQYRERYTAEGYIVPQPHEAQEFDRTLARDRVTWAALIKSRGLSLD